VIEVGALVLGLGGIGSAATYWLSRALGSQVVGMEQFAIGHHNGGSEDHSRIIRLSYHTPAYVELARRAYEAWEMVEVEGGEPVVLRTGGIDLAPPGAAIGLDDYRTSLQTAGVPHELLDTAEIVRRWPQWHLEDGVTGMYQEQSGIAMASRANAVHRRLAEEHGATLMDGCAVRSLREAGGEVEVETSAGRYLAESVVVAAGAWSGEVLAGLGVAYPLEVTLEQVVYVETSRPLSFHPARFPVWIWMDEPCFYGFPVFGEPAVKLAWDRCGVVTDPHTRSFEPRADALEAVLEFASRRLPWVDGAVRLARTCLYTLTPDRDFVIGPVPGHERISVAVGAGHAFKFASLIGRVLADIALTGSTDVDLAPFDPARPVLSESDPVRSYMV
jgi:sarcosine oxidase